MTNLPLVERKFCNYCSSIDACSQKEYGVPFYHLPMDKRQERAPELLDKYGKPCIELFVDSDWGPEYICLDCLRTMVKGFEEALEARSLELE